VRRIKLSYLREMATVKADGYLEAAFQAGTVEGDFLAMGDLDYRAWKKRFTGLGDHVHDVLGPVVRLIDAKFGTDLSNCHGCQERRKALNNLTSAAL